MKILITGSKGFLGSNLIEQLKNNNYELLTPSRTELNLVDGIMVKQYLNDHKPSKIIHLAANPNNKPNDQDPNSIINDNVLATHNVCYYAPTQCRFIFASSISVYGNTPYPVEETYICNPNTMYGVSKLACEKIVELYTKQNKIQGVSLRFCAMVGKNMTHGMLYDFFRKIKLHSNEFEVFGNEPGTCKPYLHVKDAIKSILYILHKPYITYPINIVPKGLLSVKDIASMVIKSHNNCKKIKWLGDSSIWVGDEQILQASNNRMKNVMGHNFLNYKTSYESIETAIKQKN